MPELLTEAQQTTNGTSHRSIGLDGRFEGWVDARGFRPMRSDILEAYRPPTQNAAALLVEVFAMCREGELGRALAETQRFENAPWSRGLREGVGYDVLSTALDGSVRTHVYDAWNEVAWPWLDVAETLSLRDYEIHKMDTLSGIITDNEAGNASGNGVLPHVPARADYNEASIKEKYETVQIKDYGIVFSIDERALRADDKDVFPGIPRALGRAARRTASWSVANLFEQNSGAGPTMTEDGVACFYSTHSNTAQSALDKTSLATAYNAIAAQTEYGSGRKMGLSPSWLVVPKALALTAEELVSARSTSLIVSGPITAASSATLVPSMNVMAGRLQVSEWPELSDTDAWMVMTNYRDFRTFAVAFLDGNREPIIDVQGGLGPDLSNALGRKYRVRFPHGVCMVDWRGVYRSIPG